MISDVDLLNSDIEFCYALIFHLSDNTIVDRQVYLERRGVECFQFTVYKCGLEIKGSNPRAALFFYRMWTAFNQRNENVKVYEIQ